jgi:hypothetical protein
MDTVILATAAGVITTGGQEAAGTITAGAIIARITGTSTFVIIARTKVDVFLVLAALPARPVLSDRACWDWAWAG